MKRTQSEAGRASHRSTSHKGACGRSAEGDALGQHFALYENGILQAIARLDTSEPGIAQVRFVAVELTTQGKGFGKLIMNAVEQKAKADGNSKIILHARDYAVKFYEKLDYTLLGESYKLFDILQHYLI